MAKEIQSKESKEYGKFQWFFMIIFIPVVFGIILTVVVLSFMGINVIEQSKQFAHKIPIVSSYVASENENPQEQIDVTELQSTIATQQKELELSQQKFLEKENEIESLQSEIISLTNEIQQLKNKENQLEIVTEAEQAEIITTYEAMSSKNAAAIIGQLEHDEALRHIAELKAETRAAILSKMEPEKAAELMTSLFSN